MIEIINNDRYLDPPDSAEKSLCDGCKEMFYNEDLTEVDHLYLCKECQVEYEDKGSSIPHSNPDSEVSVQP